MSPILCLQYLIEARRRLKHAGKWSEVGEVPALGGDDFFPVRIATASQYRVLALIRTPSMQIFTFVLVHAQLSDPLFIKNLLSTTVHPAFLSGEGLYYLTVFEAAVEHVRNIELTDGGDVHNISFMF